MHRTITMCVAVSLAISALVLTFVVSPTVKAAETEPTINPCEYQNTNADVN